MGACRTGSRRSDLFVGRAAELAQVAEVVTRVEMGQPWLVAIEGDPGMGKTALARRGLTGAGDLRVLSARADQAEADLDFGIADQLLRSAGGAFRTTSPGAGPTRLARRSPWARGCWKWWGTAGQGSGGVLIDDVQWADRRSVEALTFMFRRLSVDPVVAVVIYRGHADGLDEAVQRMLLSIENRVHIPLDGLSPDEVASTGSRAQGRTAGR